MKHKNVAYLFPYITIILCFSSCAFSGNNKPLGTDYRLFEDTQAENAAIAIKRHNIGILKKELEKNPDIINLQDPYYGGTLLIFATMNNYIEGVSTLLEYGADPNIVTDSTDSPGETALYSACFSGSISPEIVKILLEHGANPNFITPGVASEVVPKEGSPTPFHKSVLCEAAGTSLEKVKLLVEYGADVNKTSIETTWSPLEQSIILDKLDITLYLLEHGADYKEKYLLYVDTSEWTDIAGILKKNYYKPGTPEYAQKMKVVEFLKERGIDYESAPVPDRVRKMIMEDYPDNYEYILSIY